MIITSSRRRSIALVCAAALLALGLTVAGPAQADPGSASGFAMTLGVDDTTPAPGQTVTVSLHYAVPSFDAGADEASWGFGDYIAGSSIIPAENLADFALVPSSCTDFAADCDYDPTRSRAFTSKAPPLDPGDAFDGAAQFTVSPTATNGEHIVFYGFHEANPDERITGTPDLTLTVDAPEADLGVALSASSSTLLTNRVNYDAAVTNHGPDAASSATITTQLPSQATSIASTTCTYNSGNDRVTCPTGAIADGATTHATFTAFYGLLSIGLPLHAQATRTASSPNDPNASNDSDGADCTALTALLITC